MSADLFGVEGFESVRAFEYRRRVDRRECNLAAVVTTSHGDVAVRIIDISAGGIGFVMGPPTGLKAGERITIRNEALGTFRCTVRWALHPRYGAAFEPAGTAPQTLLAYYDSLPPGEEA